MAQLIYLMKKNITNQQKSRVILMVAIRYVKVKEIKIINYKLCDYFDIIKTYLEDMIDDYKIKGEWKIQLSIRIIFVSFTDANETQTIY